MTWFHIYIYICMAQKTGMDWMGTRSGIDGYAVIQTYGTKELRKWSQMNFYLFKRIWIGGMDHVCGSPVCPGYGSGPHILSCSPIYTWDIVVYERPILEIHDMINHITPYNTLKYYIQNHWWFKFMTLLNHWNISHEIHFNHWHTINLYAYWLKFKHCLIIYPYEIPMNKYYKYC